ncbi:MAG: hypothetical protein QOH88_2565 [Verrucomicrobiota bacterium]|jgi:hypothetical protein
MKPQRRALPPAVAHLVLVRPMRALLGIVLLVLASTAVASPRPRTYTVAQVISQFPHFRGHDIAIEGYARFDRLSRQALLYDTLASFRKRDYRRAIFLGFPLPTFDRFVLPDGTYALVSGYLSEDSHGSLGVYPGHLYADRITPLHRQATPRPNQAMQRTAR